MRKNCNTIISYISGNYSEKNESPEEKKLWIFIFKKLECIMGYPILISVR
jgi:hypothetical protein